MTDDLTQRIQIALDLLAPQDDGCNHICSDNCIEGCKHICSDNCVEGCFIHGVICDMKREREVLQKQRDVAVKNLLRSLSGHERKNDRHDQ